MLGYIAAQTERLILSTATTLITTNDPVKIAEDYAMLQHLADGRVDLMMGRGNTGPVYPWFGQDIRNGIPLAVENYALLHRLWREDVVDWEGKFRTPLQGFTSTPAPARRRAAVRLARLDPQPGDRRAGRLLRRRLLRQQHLLAQGAHPADGRALPPRFEHYGHGRADQAIVGLGGQVFMRHEQPGRRARVPAVLRQRARSTATARRWRTSWPQTPLTVGSPQQVIDRTLGFREYVGDYQRQLFLIDHAGLPLKTVLEQLDLLGERGRAGAAQGVRGAAARARARRADPRQPDGRAATPAPARRRRWRRPEPVAEAPTPLHRRTLVVVQAGLSQPSSTRLLGRPAGRGRPRRRSPRRASTPVVEVVELRDHAQDLTNNLLTGFPSPTLQAAIDTRRRRPTA